MQLLAILAIVLVEMVATALAFQPSRAGTLAFWALAGGPTVAIAALALVRAKKDGALGEWMRPRAGDATIGILGGGALFGAAYAFVRLATTPSAPAWLLFVYSQIGELDQLRSHATALIFGIIVAAAAEEIVWRGLVQELFAERFGSRIAWILQALAYAAAQLPTLFTLRPPHGALNPLLPVAALGAGLLFGLMVRRLGRLPPAIVAHALFDWLVVVMFRLWGASL
jgi:membrane protease YdiL (CAAX protease family)